MLFLHTFRVFCAELQISKMEGDFDDSRSARTSSTMSGQTTLYSSMDGTPAPSLYSYNSVRDGSAMLRDVAGRVLNAKNDLYLLPAGK